MPLLFGWLLNLVYVGLLIVVAPVLLYRRFTAGKYRDGWNEKLTGRLVRQHPERKCIWIHAVSVGEVLQIQKVISEIVSRVPNAEVFISVTTSTGFDVAKSKYPQHTISYFPLDFSWAVNSALLRIRPDLIVLVELELWPNFIFSAARRKIPLVLINGRIGAKSFSGYVRVRALIGRVLGCFSRLAVQTETYGERLRALGAPADRIVVTGNIKYDRVESNRDNPKTNELRSAFGIRPGDQVFIAGSTQDPEESYAIDAWSNLRNEFPTLQLILVSRHKERFEEVAALIQSKGFTAIRRSETLSSSVTAPVASDGIRLLDTLGELSACWGLADIAFVGGSLTKRGGQNMIEPAGFGAAVLFGPNTWNFKDITDSLLSLNAARVVTGPEDLQATIRELLRNPDQIRRMGDAAREFVASQQGATTRTVELILSALNKVE